MRIVAVIGDYYHKETLYRETLNKVLNRNNEELTLSFTTRKKLIDEIKKTPDLVILAAENRLNPEKNQEEHWLTEEGAQLISNYVKNGGSWLAWHSGLASYDMIPSYINMLGGYFTHHPDEHAVVSYRYTPHFLVKENQELVKVKDEHYFIKQMNEINIFLKSFSRDGESIAGWTKIVGEGKVAAYIPSHTKEALDMEFVQRDLSVLIDWCLNSKVKS